MKSINLNSSCRIQSGRGRRVLQIDQNSYYGGPEAGSHKTSTSNVDSFIHDPSPIVFYARGPLSDLLLSLHLTDYLDFMAVSQQFLWPAQSVLIPLPLSKEQVMLEAGLTLMEKRKLVKLLTTAATMISDNITLADLLSRENLTPESRVFQLISYAACRCTSLQEVKSLSLKSVAEILDSLRSSVNHLAPAQSPFVIPLWGSSELSQAACRRAAVSGCIQILGHSVESIQMLGQSAESVQISSNETVTRNDVAVSMSRMSLLINRPVLGITGTSLITIPPSSDLIPRPDASCINILQLTSESKCCPLGTCKRSIMRYMLMICFVGLLHLWSQAQDERDDFDDLVALLLLPETEIIWSTFNQITSLPHYTVAAPYQPLLPASFQSELDFVTRLLDFNK